MTDKQYRVEYNPPIRRVRWLGYYYVVEISHCGHCNQRVEKQVGDNFNTKDEAHGYAQFLYAEQFKKVKK